MPELQDLLARARALDAEGRPACLATVVRVEGSSYRKEGARLLAEPDGRLTGVLTGGCVERDLARLGAETLAAGAARTVVFDLTADEEAIWGTGTGCAGRLTLLLEPLDPPRRRAEIALLATVLEARREVRVATLFALDARGGEVEARIGDRAEKTLEGVVARAALRAPALAAAETTSRAQGARDLAAEATAATPFNGAFFRTPGGQRALAELARLPAGERRAIALGVEAGGEGAAEVLLESILPPIHLLIVGAERDTPALARLGAELGWAVTVADPRPDAAVAARYAGAARYLGAAPRELAAAVELSPRTAAVLATHRYLDDLAYLAELAAAPLGYVALLGPVRRRERLLADLDRLHPGAAAELRPRLKSPAGLDLGGRAPEQVGLAIVAEIQAAFSGRDGRPLSARAGVEAGAPRA
jgi:xanthine dehydrogenase accessory factor